MSVYSEHVNLARTTDSSVAEAAEIDRVVLVFAVQRAVICHLSGKALDVRRAVYVTAQAPNGQRGGMVYDADTWDEHGERIQEGFQKTFPGATFEIIDGRDYRADGSLRAEVAAARHQAQADAAV